MSTNTEIEILNTHPDTGKPTAISVHPSNFSSDALKNIIKIQINQIWPLEIHYLNKGHFYTIEAFRLAQLKDERSKIKNNFVKNAVKQLKDLDTTEIIFAEPLIPREK